MDDGFKFVDELGPAKVVHVYEPSVSLRATLVVDNVAMGPAIGGLRMAPDVSTEECFRLARAMTLKNAAAGLPHGGAKSVLYGDPKMSKIDKEKLIRAFASSLRSVHEYIFGPDMGTDEECMAWVKDEIGRSVGLPLEFGGIPLDEVGATGWGITHAAQVAAPFCNVKLDGARIAVQGFGAVGKNAARFLVQRGAILIAANDSQGTIYNAKGLDIDRLIRLKNTGRSVIEYSEGTRLDRDAVIDVECDIWIPAARPDVINEDNAHRLKTKLLVEGANIPLTYSAEESLHKRGVLCIPDFIANAGGVICAAMEYHGASQTTAFQMIEEKLRNNTRLVLEESSNKNILPRQAALQLAVGRIKKAMSCRRWSLFSSAPGFV